MTDSNAASARLRPPILHAHTRAGSTRRDVPSHSACIWALMHSRAVNNRKRRQKTPFPAAVDVFPTLFSGNRPPFAARFLVVFSLFRGCFVDVLTGLLLVFVESELRIDLCFPLVRLNGPLRFPWSFLLNHLDECEDFSL